VFDPATATALIVLLVVQLILVLVLFALVGVWVWMILDWIKRLDSDPAAAEPYKIQLLLGWPFNYYLRVYRPLGPAKR